jgi:formate dehydrogenase major subunit
VAERDWLGLGAAVKSERSQRLAPRVRNADKVVKSVCPYCAVGCAQNVYVKDEKVIQIEGDPDSPVSRGRLCPKGSASLQLTTGDARQYTVGPQRQRLREQDEQDEPAPASGAADRRADHHDYPERVRAPRSGRNEAVRAAARS